MRKIFNKNRIPYSKDIVEIRKYEEQLKEMDREGLLQYIEDVKLEMDMKKRRNQSFAVVNEAIKRILKVNPYDVQLSGGLSLTEGNVAQMNTGEGKTITALFPAFWGYVEGLKTYIVTVNEYLVERDYLQAKEVFDYLEVETGVILKSQQLHQKKYNYRRPILYVTNSEFAFDYLRDNITNSKTQLMQEEFDFVIIDEADLVLIDEAKNPVIISGNQRNNSYYFHSAKSFVNILKEEDYEIDEETLIGDLTEEGFDKAKKIFGYELIDNSEMYQAVRQCLLAEFKLQKDVDYIVKDGEVLIVDKFTGRVLGGRRFQDGLHQAIEAKEDVEVNTESTTLATTTYQNLFKKFRILSGMTGTAIESKSEFAKIYNCPVEVIPPNKPLRRTDKQDIFFKDKKSKYNYIVDLVKEKNEKGQPILIGTTSVRESEDIVRILEQEKLSFNLLNAKNDKNEADIIAKAGEKGSITIATNMAGRGTDIKISKEVEEIGGLFVLGVSRNEALRIDRQLRGRSGRQGEQGESIFFTSLEDDLFVLNKTLEFEKFIKKTKEYPVTKDIATKVVSNIQLSIESIFEKSRENQYKMDEILNYQRESIYGMRKNVIINEVNYKETLSHLKDILKDIILEFTLGSEFPEVWQLEELSAELYNYFKIKIDFKNREDYLSLKRNQMQDIIYEEIKNKLNEKELKIELENINHIAKETMLRVIDKYWVEYLQEIIMLKQGIGFISIGDSDPIRRFATEADKIFKDFLRQGKLEYFISFVRALETTKVNELKDFFTVFPIKDNYTFQLNMGLENDSILKAVLCSGNMVLTDFILQGKDDVVISIPKRLPPAMYQIKVYLDTMEIQIINFKVIDENVEIIDKSTEIIEIDVPFDQIYPIHSHMYEGILTYENGLQISLDIPLGHQLIKIGKPKDEDWAKGKYVFSLIGENLPLYMKSFIVE